MEILEAPAVAASLGLIAGVVLILVPARIASVRGDEVGRVAGAMFMSMMLAMIVLLVYVLVAEDGFIWFGGALALGFIAGLTAVAVVRLYRDRSAQG